MLSSVSIIIPAYNSQDSLTPLVDRLMSVLPGLCQQYEIIIINDGSRDSTWNVIQALAAAWPEVRGITLMRNYGQHNALLCGIRAAQHQVIITMDDDLQHPPEELHHLVAKFEEGYDVVYGTPQHEPHGLLRGLASRITKQVLQQAMGAETARYISALRIFRTDLREGFANFQSAYLSIDILLTWSTTRFAVVRVRHDPRTIGVSNYTLQKLITHAINMILGFSVLPLRLASILGFLFTGFGGIVLVYVLISYLIYRGEVPGFAFLASVITIFAGVQLFILGVMGEYLSRMYFRTLDRPAYVIKEHAYSSAKDNADVVDSARLVG